MIPWVTAVVIALLVAAVAVIALWAYQTAHRLDRLHVRYDLSWQALDGALARRAVVARAVAVDAYGVGPDGKRYAKRDKAQTLRALRAAGMSARALRAELGFS